MKVILITLLLLLSLLTAQAQPNKVVTEYDKFDDKTIIALQLIFTGGNLIEGFDFLQLTVGHFFSGQEMKETAKDIFCIFEVVDAKSEAAEGIVFLVNNSDRVKPQRFTHSKTERESNRYRHRYVCLLSYGDFIKIAYGQAEFKLGTFVGKTDDDQRKLLREFDLKVSKKS